MGCQLYFQFIPEQRCQKFGIKGNEIKVIKLVDSGFFGIGEKCQNGFD
jgi:hypothetical protein